MSEAMLVTLKEQFGLLRKVIEKKGSRVQYMSRSAEDLCGDGDRGWLIVVKLRIASNKL